MSQSLYQQAHACLMAQDPALKGRLSRETAQAWHNGALSLHADGPAEAVPEPGRPERPVLVPPREVPQRKITSPEGRAALLHALAHIEFNAINLAWDAVYRFRDLPADFYSDWIQVAEEEVLHFNLLTEYLAELGHAYGDFPAHNSLWEAACDTAHDPLARMALVPRTLEARGLDVTPAIMDKLAQAGDRRAVAILQVIFRDEVGHVAAGSRWFNWLCQQRGLPPAETFGKLIRQYLRGTVKPPFHHEARQQAGFTEADMAVLAEMTVNSS